MKNKLQFPRHYGCISRAALVRLLAMVTVVMAAIFVSPIARAQTYQVLHRFAGDTDGMIPFGGLTRDSAGNLYGTTISGGAGTGGTIFKITPAGQKTTLHSFNYPEDGGGPAAGLVQDAAGNFYGTTFLNDHENCGSMPGDRCGTVFKLSKSGQLTTLYTFNGPRGDAPRARLLLDRTNNLYGTTGWGGKSRCLMDQGLPYTCGLVFKLTKGTSVPWKQTVLHNFNAGSDGWHPFGALIADAAGNIYGTSRSSDLRCDNGPSDACGTVFKLSRDRGRWKFTLFHVFKGGPDGGDPVGGVIVDSAGNLYGTTSKGGSGGLGTIFKLDPSGNKTILHSFGGPDGATPNATLVRDNSGNLFGTTREGGTSKVGTVFRLDPSGNLTVLHSFQGGTDGAYPEDADLVADESGSYYGTTSRGGIQERGTVFKITP
jgi:uncharacterized repeat protein (TIGR03803 family)